jgi:hypothetical protein
MMKTHVLATVSLGMKNLIGLYPGIIYKTVRAGVHDYSADVGSPGIAFEILDSHCAHKFFEGNNRVINILKVVGKLPLPHRYTTSARICFPIRGFRAVTLNPE